MIRDFVIFIRCIKILKCLIHQLSDKVVSYREKQKVEGSLQEVYQVTFELMRRGQMITSKSTVHVRNILLIHLVQQLDVSYVIEPMTNH